MVLSRRETDLRLRHGTFISQSRWEATPYQAGENEGIQCEI
jgi:hypothetical protein